jgi:hypothetical protein
MSNANMRFFMSVWARCGHAAAWRRYAQVGNEFHGVVLSALTLLNNFRFYQVYKNPTSVAVMYICSYLRIYASTYI